MDARNGENDGSYLEVPRKLQPTRVSHTRWKATPIMKGIPSLLVKVAFFRGVFQFRVGETT